MQEFLVKSTGLGLAVTGGNIAIWLGLASAVLSVIFYWIAMLRSPKVEAAASGTASVKGATTLDPRELSCRKFQNLGKRFFTLTCAFCVLGSLCLWSLIFSQQYTIHYVFKNSNSSLHPGFRFASFWGDQQGTFFLWGLYNAVLGAVFLRKCRESERWVMPFFGLINVSLFLLLTLMNPFWIDNPNEVRAVLTEMKAPESFLAILPTNTMEHLKYYFGWASYLKKTDGRGLNEQLQNFWMVIHPPTLFLGYASMLIPSAFALGALMKRDYNTWVKEAAPWLTFAWAVLGTGIFLGAYWAYETLGWGGYWSWDPVENSSFIPWLVGTALLHGLLAQGARGNFKQANLFLGGFLGTTVLLGSFLVRSGVLDGISVHSFASPQESVYATLLGILILWFTLSIGIWIWRFRDIQSEIAYDTVWERHFGFFLGLIVLSASAAVITFGVTMPIWGAWFRVGQKTVDYSFYNKALLPVTFVMVLLMGITPLMPWRKVREDRGLAMFAKVVLALMGVACLWFAGAAVYAWQGGFSRQNDPAFAAFGLMLLIAVTVNIRQLVKASGGGLLACGPWLAHTGFIIMLGAIVVTSRFNVTFPVEGVAQGEPVKIMGREFSWAGQRTAENSHDRDRMLIDMKGPDGKVTQLAPKLFISKQTNEAMGWPEIRHEWVNGAWGDIYVVPSGVDLDNSAGVEDVAKEEPATMSVQHSKTDPKEQVQVTFHGLDTSELQKMMNGKNMPTEPKIYGDVSISVNGAPVQKIRPAILVAPGEGERPFKFVPQKYPITGLNQSSPYALEFSTNMNPGDLKGVFKLVPENPVPRGHFQVLYVPGIQFMWWGAYVMIVGMFISYRRRSLLSRKALQVAAAAEAVRASPAGSKSSRRQSPVGVTTTL